MLTGDGVMLRPVRESDLEALWERHADLDDRGPYFPIGVMSWPRFQRQFAESGMWTDDEGMLVVADAKGEILGHIEFFHTLRYLDELELSYQVYGTHHRRKGVATEAVRLMTKYLFERTKTNRIRLMIHPENKASARVAEKAGYAFESLARGIWYNRGRNHDLSIWVMLRGERPK